MRFALPQIRLPQFSKKTWFLIAGGGILALILIIILISVSLPKPKEETYPLTIWTSYETQEQMTTVLQNFMAQFPQVSSIDFKQIPADEYENELLNALAADQGPDVFVLSNDLLTKHLDKIYPMPSSLMLPEEFRQTFYDVAAFDCIRKDLAGNEYIMGLPLNMDALALFYNSEMLAQANVEPPQTWTDFVLAINKLRDVQKGGTAVRRAGAALGTASNVNFATDILYLLMLQNGTKMLSDDKSTATFHLSETGPGGQPRFLGTEALSFYTAFAIPDSSVSTDLGTVEVYNWNQSMPNSLQAFTRRKTAMMFGYASQIETLQKLGLKFGVVPAPQPEPELVDQTVREKAVNYAQYQIITVARKSAHPAAAWALANYLVSAEAQKILNQTTQRLSARRDLREEQMKIRLYGTFVEEFETAQNWYKKDPNKMNKIFETAINAVALFGQSPQNALESAAQSANVILREK